MDETNASKLSEEETDVIITAALNHDITPSLCIKHSSIKIV